MKSNNQSLFYFFAILASVAIGLLAYLNFQLTNEIQILNKSVLELGKVR